MSIMAFQLLLALSALSSIQSVAAQTIQTTWASFVYTYHGESAPALISETPNLTPTGAQQALAAGEAIRTRYVQGPGNNITNSYLLNGVARNIIDNSQLYLLATHDDYVVASAQAFMQGVYPPVGGEDDGETSMADGSYAQYPLDGYQYATLNAVTENDFNYIWVDGNAACINYDIATFDYSSSPSFLALSSGTQSFYQSLVPLVFGPIGYPSSQVSYHNAYDVYAYTAYAYEHNATIQKNLPASSLAILRDLASQHEYALNANLSAYAVTPGDNILAMAGRTLAFKALAQLSANLNSFGVSDKLSLFFGSYEPFLSFFALAGLGSRDSNTHFQSLPEPGSMMVFELFSNTNATLAAQVNYTIPYPNETDLWVRFLFRNGTDPASPLLSYPLFDRGNSQTDMTWAEFVKGMQGIAMSDISTWCNTCGNSGLFCPIFTGLGLPTPSGVPTISAAGGSAAVSPQIAGVIGAVVTLVVAALIFALAMLLFGVRFHQREGIHRGSLGGFKGAEKMKSDTDVNVLKSDGVGASATVRHERVGSWEMGEAGRPETGSLDKDLESGRAMAQPGHQVTRDSQHESVVSHADYGDRDDASAIDVNPFGDPVKIDDRI